MKVIGIANNETLICEVSKVELLKYYDAYYNSGNRDTEERIKKLQVGNSIDLGIIEQLRKMSDAQEPAQHILEEWDSMCAKAYKSLHSDCPLLEDEVLSEMHKYVGALMIAKMSDWMPIETVPRDGTKIIISDGVLVEEAFWQADIRRTREFVRKAKDGDVYRVEESDIGYWSCDEIYDPTHWKHKPKPPNSKEL